MHGLSGKLVLVSGRLVNPDRKAMPGSLIDDSRVRISPETKDGLTPKTGPEHTDLRGMAIQPSLHEWRNLKPRELQDMIERHYVHRTDSDRK